MKQTITIALIICLLSTQAFALDGQQKMIVQQIERELDNIEATLQTQSLDCQTLNAIFAVAAACWGVLWVIINNDGTGLPFNGQIRNLLRRITGTIMLTTYLLGTANGCDWIKEINESATKK